MKKTFPLLVLGWLTVVGVAFFVMTIFNTSSRPPVDHLTPGTAYACGYAYGANRIGNEIPSCAKFQEEAIALGFKIAAEPR